MSDQQQLDEIHQEIVQDYPRLDHLDPSRLESLASQRQVVIFDVREADEFAVSHLEGAIRVDPDIDAEGFSTLFGESLKGKDVVFYCSVGRRSSRLADRIADDLFASGSGDVYNLRNGIFGWHNKEMPLVAEPHPQQKQPTSLIHPYNRRWGQLLNRGELRSYTPSAE